MSNFTLADPKGWDCDLQSVRVSVVIGVPTIRRNVAMVLGLLGLHGPFPTPQRAVVSTLVH